MTDPAETIMDAQLHAYVDEQLDAKGRFEVEEFLRKHPERAAQVLTDMSVNRALKLLAAPATADGERPETLALARRLEGALARKSYAPGLRKIAAALVVFVLGWAAGFGWTELRDDEAETQPSIASSAMQPQAAILAGLRDALHPASTRARAVTATELDPAEVGKALSLALPRIPKGWHLVELHIVPGLAGPGVQLVLDAPEFGRLALFAGSTDHVGISFPTITKSNGGSFATWQIVSDQYMLTGNLQSRPLELAALELYQTLY